MSHFTSVKVELKSMSAVRKALTHFGIKVLDNDSVRGYRGQCIKAELVARLEGAYDIGFDQEDGKIVAKADFGEGSCQAIFEGEERTTLQDAWTRIRAMSVKFEAEEDIARTQSRTGSTTTINVRTSWK